MLAPQVTRSQTFAQPQAQHHLPLSFYIFFENLLAHAHDCHFVCKSILSKTGFKKMYKKLHYWESVCRAGFKEIIKLAQAIFIGLMPGNLGHPSPLDNSA